MKGEVDVSRREVMEVMGCDGLRCYVTQAQNGCEAQKYLKKAKQFHDQNDRQNVPSAYSYSMVIDSGQVPRNPRILSTS
jgi:hypothetical protein